MEAAVTVLAVKWQGNIAPQIMLNGMRKFFTLPEVRSVSNQMRRDVVSLLG